MIQLRRVIPAIASVVVAALLLVSPVGPGFSSALAGSIGSKASTPATDESRAALKRAADLVDQAQRSSGTERTRAALAALVELDARPEFVGDAWLRAPLAKSPADLPEAKTRLQTALDVMGPPTAPVASADARSQLEGVLADARFHPRDWLSFVPAILLPIALVVVAVVQAIWSVVRWPFDRLLDLFGWIVGGPLFGPAMLVGAIVVAGGLVALYRRGLGSALVGQSEAAAARFALPPTSRDALAAAQEHATAGRYREASHFVFLSTLLWIEEQGVARFDRAATNREHLARLAGEAQVSSGELARGLEPIVARFDRLWYGQSTVTDADYRELRSLTARLQTVAA